MRLSRRIVTTVAAVGTAVALGACTSTPPVVDSTASVPSRRPTVSPSSTKPPAVIAQPQQGMLTGPGVSDASISLGLIVDASTDRGFTDGVKLWRDTVNTTGGICGRTIALAIAAAGSAPEVSYETLGRSTLGLITMESGAAGMTLASRIRADRIPAFTPEGTSGKRSESGPPIVLGATDDILAINTAAHLLSTGVIPANGTLGVLVDDSAAAADVMQGLAWWADKNKVTLRPLPETGSVPADIPAVFAAVHPAQVASLLLRTSPAGGAAVTSAVTGSAGAAGSSGNNPAGTTDSAASAGGGTTVGTVTVGTVTTTKAGGADSGAAASSPAGDGAAASAVAGSGPRSAGSAGPIIATTLDGFDPSLVPAGQAGRLLVATVTPSAGADHPGVKAVDAAYAAAGHYNPGPRLLEGYATGTIWAGLLEPMCSARTLTRSAALAELAQLAPSSPDSLFGPTNPNVALSGAPASRVSALSIADPAAPAGLRPLTLLESAPGIADYRSG
ncbi:MAG: ABC transporter substrate-binding protein [Actinomycetota bacterium]|nr:ABC transporter substrate-binding protein [Actinomycetota bacterium]